MSTPPKHPCLLCGACCAFMRVSFYQSELKLKGGTVPTSAVRPIHHEHYALRGTTTDPPRCDALQGEIGVAAHCGMYAERPTPCRDFEPSWEFGRANSFCDQAREKHDLKPLVPADWVPFQT